MNTIASSTDESDNDGGINNVCSSPSSTPISIINGKDEIPLAKDYFDFWMDYAQQNACCDEYDTSMHEKKTLELKLNEAFNRKQKAIKKVLDIAFTDHLCERLQERGFCSTDFHRTVLYGSKCIGDYGGWKFTYKRMVAITDCNVQVGITMYEDEEDNTNISCCPECGQKGLVLCYRGYCHGCCFGCNECSCPNSK